MKNTKRDDCRTYAEQLIGLLEVALRQADSLVGVDDEQRRCLSGLCSSIWDAAGKARRYADMRRGTPSQSKGAEDEELVGELPPMG